MEERTKDKLILIAKAVAASLGQTCETVVHDEAGTIVYIENGHISGRGVGYEMDKSVYEYLYDRARKEGNIVVRLTKKKTGELLKSTTVMFLDNAGVCRGMFCFTQDVTRMNEVRNLLDSIMNIAPFENESEQKNNLSIVEYTRMVIADIIKEVGKPSTLGPKEIKLTILRKLDEKGVFLIKDSIPQVCDLLSISQATLYNYLREIRTANTELLPFN